MAFFGTFSSVDLVMMPNVLDAFRLYLRMLMGMTIVFSDTDGRLLPREDGRVVTARFLWRNIKYAMLIIFIVAAVLTPSADPWNQALFAAPMIGALRDQYRNRVDCRPEAQEAGIEPRGVEYGSPRIRGCTYRSGKEERSAFAKRRV